MSEIILEQCSHEDEDNCAHCGYNMRDLDAEISDLRAALDLAESILDRIVMQIDHGVRLAESWTPSIEEDQKIRAALQSIRSARTGKVG